MSDLTDVAIGEKIIVKSFGRHGIYVVERLTPTQVVCANGVRFNRKTGYRVGEESSRGFGYSVAQKMTEDDYIEIRIQRAARSLHEMRVTRDNLEAVEQLVRDDKHLSRQQQGGGE